MSACGHITDTEIGNNGKPCLVRNDGGLAHLHGADAFTSGTRWIMADCMAVYRDKVRFHLVVIGDIHHDQAGLRHQFSQFKIQQTHVLRRHVLGQQPMAEVILVGKRLMSNEFHGQSRPCALNAHQHGIHAIAGGAGHQPDDKARLLVANSLKVHGCILSKRAPGK
ncbi:MAG: hypothetical protein BWX80_04189 [Candidatus Hydrogenedentes bacterium ADurb.Bin101]|nr:MAG: hypothetical protein BWX80_04189 [Candidatus Hydrogenedentes bacterium ADurb.Bin101]